MYIYRESGPKKCIHSLLFILHVKVCVHFFGPLCIYTYMEHLVKPEILTSYLYGPTSGNAESRLFLLASQYFNI
jgi:hypothetical protein